VRNRTDGYGIATKLSKNIKRMTLSSGSPEYEILDFTTQRWVEGDKRNREKSDCRLYVYESLENKTKVFAAVHLRIPLFWDITLRQRVTGFRRFGAIKCIYLQGLKVLNFDS
jgi:hypothetical protein